MFAPWSEFWNHNFFAASAPALQPWVESPFVRGAVSGIGGVTALAGLAEVGSLLTRRRSRERLAAEPADGSGWTPER